MVFACIARSTSSIRCAAARKSASVYPFVVIAAVPMRTPEVCWGLLVSL